MTTLGPYELNTIVTGECSAMMAALPSNCIDFWLTSPPYDNQRLYNGFTFGFERIAAQLYRVTKQGGVGVWVVADETKDGSESGTSFRQALGFMAVGFNLHDTMIYKQAGVGAKGSHKAYWQSFEYMFIFSKGEPKTINLLRDKKNSNRGLSHGPSGEKHNGLKSRMAEGYKTQAFGIRENVWIYFTGNTNGDDLTSHPAPFPEALARDHILSWSMPGDTVLDPMTGSGTTAKQAHLLGRHYLGFDISEEYCQLARRRLANVEAQPFLMPPSVETNGKPVQAQLGLDAT